MSTFVAILSGVGLLLIAAGLAQYSLGIIGGRVESKRSRKRAVLRRAWAVAGSDTAEALTLYVVIPCLNEESVLANTLAEALASSATAKIIVVDDGSDDATAQIARLADPSRVSVVCRQLPLARLGKGPALNAGFTAVLAAVEESGLDPNQVVVCVMDADGRLSPGAVPEALRLFADPEVGGVQLPVRISNRTTLLTEYQDFEFWGVSALAQLARQRVGTTSLGGNGQFARLSALMSVGDEPWTASLTEDLDLAVSLLIRGWRLTSTSMAFVEQQAVTSLRRLLRQRTRWMQGHMTCATRLRELWRADRLSNAALAEISSYLLSPILLVLPWSILFNVGLIWSLQALRSAPPFAIAGSETLGRLVLWSGWYAWSFLPAMVNGELYHRRSGRSRSRSLLLSHLFILFHYVTFLACWRALFRIVGRRRSWAKTARHLDVITGGVTVTATAQPGTPQPTSPVSSSPRSP